MKSTGRRRSLVRRLWACVTAGSMVLTGCAGWHANQRASESLEHAEHLGDNGIHPLPRYRAEQVRQEIERMNKDKQ